MPPARPIEAREAREAGGAGGAGEAGEAGEAGGAAVEERPPVPAAPSQEGQEPPRAGGDDGLFAGDRGFLSDFVWEATEHLEEIDTLLLDLEKSTICADTLNGLFRCFHTIKGVADFLGLVDISSLAHGVESLLDRHRESRIACAASTLDLLFEATDLLRNRVNSVRVSIVQEGEIETDPRVPKFIARLESACVAEKGSSTDRSCPEPIPAGGTERPEEPPVALAEPRQHAGAPSGATAGASASATPHAPEKRATLDISPTVKVDSRRLDLLLDTIGELVVAVSMANQRARRPAAEAESDARIQVDKLTRSVQELGTSLRMMPLVSTFRKMTRLSRDLGKRCGKSLRFSFSGEGMELDRTIVQQIQDPLLHILRNAIDHGLESTEERVKAGKPEVGYVSARAYHRGGSFFIEVADDGRGLDSDLILKKAQAAGAVPEGHELSRQEILDLVFEPGFSTAEKVTNISGRGVGMDVVKRMVEKLGGSVNIESAPGKGTEITLRLPLTVAVIEGMVIRVGDQRFIVPTLALIRVHRPRPGEIRTVSQRQEFLSTTDQLIPLVRLGRVFEIEGAETELNRGVVILVEGKGRPVGLLVDEMIGQQQIVIKGLGRALQNVPGIAGGAVMPDGRVGLILDVQGILEMVHNSPEVLLGAVG